MLIFCWIIVVQKILLESQALSLGHRYQYRFWILTEKSSFRNCLITRCRLTEIASLVCWISLFFCLIATNQNLRDTSVSRGEQTGIIIAGVPFLLSPIPCPFFPTSFFSFLPSPTPPFNACYAGYTSTNSHQFGTFSFFYPNPPYQADWALLQLLLLLLIHGAAPCLTD